jgi:hypothetical protein
MKQAVELAGFFAAHAIWCISGGAALTPLAGYETKAGERRTLRFAAEKRERGVEQGQRWLASNPDGALRAVLVYDGHITIKGERTDALLVDVRRFVAPLSALLMAVPYRHATSPRGFAVYRPTLLESSAAGRLPPGDFGKAFFEGVYKHEKGAKVWDEHLDESR